MLKKFVSPFCAAQLFLFFVTFFLASCQKSKPVAIDPKISPPAVLPQLPDEVKDSEHEKDKKQFEIIDEALKFDVLSYALEGKFEFSQTHIPMSAEIQFQMIRSEKFSELPFDSKGLNIQSVRFLEGQNQRELNWRIDSKVQKLYVDVSDLNLIVDKTYKLSFGYTVDVLLSEALSLVLPRKGDPVAVPALYTSSEPRSASSWMPCQDRPDDRAKFAITMDIPTHLSLVSNGRLVLDQVKDNQRIMKWQSDFALPSYVMAFAVSEFETKKLSLENGKQNLELSLWWRKGLPVNANEVLLQTRRQMEIFSELMGPYPWEKYAIVLLPDFGGGMENVSVTFNDEVSSSLGNYGGDFSLMAHELGHQWFGDFVTIKNWDDLWIKEGMATLLALEATRDFEGIQNNRKGLGEGTWFESGEAIFDSSLAPERKYTSGPYDRAAWLLNQLRLKLGEKTFWLRIRELVLKYALSSVSTQDFINHFEKDLSLDEAARFKKALIAKIAPALIIEKKLAGLGFRIEDKEEALFRGLEIQEISDVKRESHLLGGLGGQTEVLISHLNSSFLSFDLDDAHPDLSAFVSAATEEIREENFKQWSEYALPLFVPKSLVQMNLFQTLPSIVKGFAFSETFLWKSESVLSAEMLTLAFDNNEQKSYVPHFMNIYCERMKLESTSEMERARYAQELRKSLDLFDLRAMNSWTKGVENCKEFLPDLLQAHFDLLSELNRLPRNQSYKVEETLMLLSHFKMQRDEALEFWIPWFEMGESVRVKSLALKNGVAASLEILKEDPTDSQRELIFIALRSFLTETRLSRHLNVLLPVFEKFPNPKALPEFVTLIDDSATPLRSRTRTLCLSFGYGKDFFDSLKSELKNVSSFPSSLQQILQTPEEFCAH